MLVVQALADKLRVAALRLGLEPFPVRFPPQGFSLLPGASGALSAGFGQRLPPGGSLPRLSCGGGGDVVPNSGVPDGGLGLRRLGVGLLLQCLPQHVTAPRLLEFPGDTVSRAVQQRPGGFVVRGVQGFPRRAVALVDNFRG